MAKLIFSTKKQPQRGLPKIIFGIVLVLVLGYGTLRLAAWVFPWMRGQAEVSARASFEQAQALYAKGDLNGACELLRPAAARVKDPSTAPRLLLFLADLETASGNAKEAMGVLERATKNFPSSPDHPVAAARYARALEAVGRMEEALALYTELRDNAPPELRVPALVGLGRKASRDKDALTARDLFRQAVNEAPWNSEAWNEAVDALGKVNVDLAFSPVPTPESKYYAVEKGDNLTNIGIKLNTTQGLLLQANALTETTSLSLGQRLKYTPKDLRILIERSTCRLFLVDTDGLFKRYPLGLGMPGHETTLGRYTIGNKQKDPTWFKPGAGPIPPGAPNNELGTRWMPLVPAEPGLPTDLGIHGTIAPETIGAYKSHGCPRMLKEDVEELFDLVVRSTPVEIVEVMDPIKAA